MTRVLAVRGPGHFTDPGLPLPWVALLKGEIGLLPGGFKPSLKIARFRAFKTFSQFAAVFRGGLDASAEIVGELRSIRTRQAGEHVDFAPQGPQHPVLEPEKGKSRAKPPRNNLVRLPFPHLPEPRIGKQRRTPFGGSMCGDAPGPSARILAKSQILSEGLKPEKSLRGWRITHFLSHCSSSKMISERMRIRNGSPTLLMLS